MKRTLLAVTIPALLLANTAHADIEIFNNNGNVLNLYGKVLVENFITKQGNIDQGDSSFGRLGFNGMTQITDSLKGYGRVEFNKYAGKGSSETRYAYAGLDFGPYGHIDYGRNDGVAKMVTAYTDVLSEWGGEVAAATLLGLRESAVVTYRVGDLYGAVPGLNLAVQYADKAENGASVYIDNEDGYNQSSDGYNRANRQAFGISATYAILDSGFNVAANYSATSKAAIDGLSVNNEKHRGQSWIIAGNYDANNLYVGVLYNQGKNLFTYRDYNASQDADLGYGIFATNVKGYEISIAYEIPLTVGAIRPNLGYDEQKAKLMGADDYVNLSKSVLFGLDYELNNHFATWVSYNLNLLHEDDGVTNAETKNSVALGAVYYF